MIALGEHAELETQATIGGGLGYVSPADMQAFAALSTEVGALTHGLLRALEAMP